MNHSFIGGSYFRYLFPTLLILALLVYSCANRVPPNGGSKDETPPSILGVNPPNKQLSFKGDEIVLLFDEYIDIKDAQNQIIISPFMKQQPEFKRKGKSLVVKFKEALRPNTTYTINFGESIIDITESNALKDLEYTFSTGDQLDSLLLTGNVLNAATASPVEKAAVLLYPASPDSLFTTTTPYYAIRTNASGTFQLNNIAAGTYQIYALADKNNNYFYDQPTEGIAFLDTTITIDTLTALAEPLQLFTEGSDKLKLLERQHREYGRIQLLYSRPIDSLAINIIDNTLADSSVLISQSAKNDTVNVWFKDIEESTEIHLVANDFNDYQDTISYRSLKDEKTLKKLTFISNMTGGRGQSYIHIKKPVWLEFNHPIKDIQIDQIQLLKDSTEMSVTSILKRDQHNPRKIYFKEAWEASAKYILTIPDSTIYDFFGLANKEIQIPFIGKAKDKYGNLIINLEDFDNEQQYILQIKDTYDKIEWEGFLTEAQLQLDYMEVGKYNVFVVEDANKNGKWDTGNYKDKLQPERVFRNAATIQIKANWDTEVKMSLD